MLIKNKLLEASKISHEEFLKEIEKEILKNEVMSVGYKTVRPVSGGGLADRTAHSGSTAGYGSSGNYVGALAPDNKHYQQGTIGYRVNAPR